MGALEELFASFGDGSYNKQTRICLEVGCEQRVFGYALFCPESHRKIPSDIRRLLEKHHRPGCKPSKACAHWIQEALDELLALRTNGKYRPATQSFIWDDEPPAPARASEPLFKEPAEK